MEDTFVNMVLLTSSRVIGFDKQFLMDYILQGISSIIMLVLVVLVIRVLLLASKALKIYIDKNK